MPDFPEEVVTRALVRDVELPHGAGTLALVTLENGQEQPTTLGPQGLRALDAALRELAGRGDLAAVAVTGKPFVFCVGANLKVIGSGGARNDALALARAGHAAFRHLRDSAVPTFAFVNGPAMGGGLEVALHCHYRTVAAGVRGIALPETRLGLVPGWGGTQLLPHLVGPDTAVRVVVEDPLADRRLDAVQALELGVVDAAFEPADFLERSLDWAARVVRGEVEVVRRPPAAEQEWAAALARGRRAADAKTHGHAPAPYRALDLLALARTAAFDEGTRAEDDALADLAFSDELRAGLYAFDLVQRRAKRPADAPPSGLARPVTKVGVVGAGLMASQLALLFARRLQVPVVLTDLDQERVDRGLERVRADVQGQVAKGRLSPAAAQRVVALVTGTTDLGAFADADFVIEAVFEEMGVKQQVLSAVEAVVGPECVLATNTSSLSVTRMGSGLARPERLVGFHFFNPVAVLPLLEVVRTGRTDDATLATAFATARALRKSAVLVRDATAFVVNRLLLRAMGEVVAAVDEGTPVAVADAATGELGLPMSPFALLELVGPAVTLHVAESLHEAYPGRFGVSEGLRALVASGLPGAYVRDGRGRPSVDPRVEQLWPQGSAPLTTAQVRDRVRDALAEEVRALLDEGVVAEPQDVDLCLLLGAGWASWNGGITPYLDRTGAAERVTGRRFLPPGVASLPA
ncbi:3-hydroxyacyl-CoA dehydrogenase [Vallicoccus soli]|uniref:3-hydroxyacyl-CoA dehydrogenase n=1 Tax=Vallicoccus soli TaxID=2339232 RepID=A0A3A3YRR5_9ACTN|nr:3-hydroxyacyl-CoA dehydrogenase [Vallicoccus soli]